MLKVRLSIPVYHFDFDKGYDSTAQGNYIDFSTPRAEIAGQNGPACIYKVLPADCFSFLPSLYRTFHSYFEAP